jgi:hypothetical protein
MFADMRAFGTTLPPAALDVTDNGRLLVTLSP